MYTRVHKANAGVQRFAGRYATDRGGVKGDFMRRR